MKDHH